MGKTLAFAMFDQFPGPWQVRQIPTAKEAIAFWRSIISEYTNNNFKEDYVVDPHWGNVLRQTFESQNLLN